MTDLCNRFLPQRLARAAFPRLVRHFLRRKDGAVAVEFAMVAAPFLALVFAILETSIVFFAGQTLETAAADSARLIMTGQAQKQGFSQAQFKTASLQPDLWSVRLQRRRAGGRADLRGFQFNQQCKANRCEWQSYGDSDLAPGGPGDIVVVRLLYKWPVYVSLLGLNLSDVAGSNRLIMATAAFRNEPYQ